jgi:hypothetical protein
LELLHEAAPARIIGLLVNTSVPALAEATRRDVQAAARMLGLEPQVLREN